MIDLSFVQFHSCQASSHNSEETDYSLKDQCFIQYLKAMEEIIDIDAYIIDYMNKRILYATKNSFIRFDRNIDEHSFVGIRYLDNVILEEDLLKISRANARNRYL